MDPHHQTDLYSVGKGGGGGGGRGEEEEVEATSVCVLYLGIRFIYYNACVIEGCKETQRRTILTTPKTTLFQRKKLPRVGFEPITLCSLGMSEVDITGLP